MPTTGAGTSARPRPGNKRLGVVFLVLIYAAAVILLLVPAVLLGIGLQALGRKLGLWIGEATSNDGEESWATIAGLVAFTSVLAGAGLGAWAVARRHGMQPLPVVAIATAVVLIGYAVWLVPFFT